MGSILLSMNTSSFQRFLGVFRNLQATVFAVAATMGAAAMEGSGNFVSDHFSTSAGKLEIVFIGHSTLAMQVGSLKIHIDPQSRYTDYSRWEKADLILITHEHADHLDLKAISSLSGPQTRIITSKAVRDKIGMGEVLEHGKSLAQGPLSVTAFPAYNITNGREMYHPKSRLDNGYILALGGLRVYVAGDTENIPEMASLDSIDVAFLPMNQPFTMTVPQVAEAVRAFKPKIVYPYHYSSTDPRELVRLLEKDTYTEVRIRKM